ncbi:MAG: type II toxin-antitoxin system RelE/ParE family toxin [Ottowia sp.]|nr:type II toxin-antitoxin system RelE/ParE family toxin [Ottowia sp.]
MPYSVQWSDQASDDVREWGVYVARQTSKQYADELVQRLEQEVREALGWSPQGYSPAPDWGEGVRRLPVLGRRVLFEVDEAQRVARILAVVGGAENPRDIR